MTFYSSTVATPIGELLYLYSKNKIVQAVYFDVQAQSIETYLQKQFGAYEIITAKKGVYDTLFKKYFKSELDALNTIPVNVSGTDTQIAVWNVVGKIKAGTVLRYKDVALLIKKEKAVRAVGSATGANPVCLIIPCHRVVTSDGGIAGYAGGTTRKEWLLRHEGVLV